MNLSIEVYVMTRLQIPVLLIVLLFLPHYVLAEMSGILFRTHLTPEAAAELRRFDHEVPVTGRAFVIISREGEREPRLQVHVTGPQLFGKNVRDVKPEHPIEFQDGGGEMTGYPHKKFIGLEPGYYYVQTFLTIYTTFERSDGHIVDLFHDTGAGGPQRMFAGPGNVHSDVQRIYIDPSEDNVYTLELKNVIPPLQPVKEEKVLQQGNPRDTDWVKYVKIKSDLLTEFWGKPMYIGANVLLPKGYNEAPDNEYPVIFHMGHFPGERAPLRFREGAEGSARTKGLYDFWVSEDAPRFIAVSIRDANPYFGTSYSVNSKNVGPYGDAITEELIPYLEEKFRMVGEPWARVLAGGSTGGWEALALQVWYPEFFGGTWSWCPDPVDFNHYQLVNIYEDDNAYYKKRNWIKTERPSNRNVDGNINYTIKQELHWERALGTNSRSGRQWAIWEAVFSPVGADGYPAPIWDPVTGEIDTSVAEYWRENYDIHHYLKENWETVGELLQGKIHIATGDMDNYYLELAVYLLEDFLNEVDNPPANAVVEYGRRQPHCWIGESPERPGEELTHVEFIRLVADYMKDRAQYD